MSDLVHRLRQDDRAIFAVREAADALEAQAKRITELEQALDESAVSEFSARERVAELETEMDALKVDAERYRWFRNKLRNYDGDVALWEHTKGCDYDIKQGANLDAAIDAAIKEQP